MSAEIIINPNPAVLTTGQVANTGLQTMRGGIKSDPTLESLMKLLSWDNCQTFASGDASNSAITVRVNRTELDKWVKLLSNLSIAQNTIISNCVSQLQDILALDSDDNIAELNRGNMAAITNTAHEIEEVQSIQAEAALKARMILLSAAGTSFVSQPNRDEIEGAVNALNLSLGNGAGNDLLEDALNLAPTDIGMAPHGTTVREGDIPFDSMAAVRVPMGSNAQRNVNLGHIDSLDAFSSPDIAVTPLGDMTTLLRLVRQPGMVQSNPYVPIPLRVTKDVDGFVTDVAYDMALPLSDSDIGALDMTLPFLRQDFTAVLFTDTTHTTILSTYDMSNCGAIDQSITLGDNLIEMMPSGKTVSGATAFAILSSLNRMWNAFKNYTGASNANIASMIGIGAQLAGGLIGGTTGTTISKIGNFVSQASNAFTGDPISQDLMAQKMTLNYAPNLGRLAEEDATRHTVSSTVTASAIDSFANRWRAAEATTMLWINGKNVTHPTRIISNRGRRIGRRF